MAQNFKHKGDVLQLMNESGATITSGGVFIKGKFVGVALQDIADDAVGPVAIEGVFELPKATGTAITAGDVVCWDTATGKVTKDITGNDPIIGIAATTVASGGTTIEVCIDETPIQAATQAASTASDVAGLKTDFNALLTKLKAVGIMAS